MENKRVGISVWVQSLKQVRQLRKFGNIHYVSKKMKYVVMYCEIDKADDIVEKLQSLHFVKKVSMSMWPWIKTEYQNTLKEAEKEREYQYNTGM